MDKPKIGDDYVNTFEGFLHQKKDYTSYPENIKKKVDQFNDYIMKVLASGNKKAFDYILKWYANVAKVRKINQCFILEYQKELVRVL